MINSLAIDFIIRIKNGNKAGLKSITAPSSKFLVRIAELMKKNNYIADFKVDGETKKTITVDLAYNDNQPKVNEVTIFSKPGRRFYEKSSSLPWGKTKEALIIISTSAGLLTQKEAKVKGFGGEVIAEIR